MKPKPSKFTLRARKAREEHTRKELTRLKEISDKIADQEPIDLDDWKWFELTMRKYRDA